MPQELRLARLQSGSASLMSAPALTESQQRTLKQVKLLNAWRFRDSNHCRLGPAFTVLSAMVSLPTSPTTHGDIGGVCVIYEVSAELVEPSSFNKVITDVVGRRGPMVLHVVLGDAWADWLHKDADLLLGDLITGTATGLHCTPRYSSTGQRMHYFILDFSVSSLAIEATQPVQGEERLKTEDVAAYLTSASLLQR